MLPFVADSSSKTFLVEQPSSIHPLPQAALKAAQKRNACSQLFTLGEPAWAAARWVSRS